MPTCQLPMFGIFRLICYFLQFYWFCLPQWCCDYPLGVLKNSMMSYIFVHWFSLLRQPLSFHKDIFFLVFLARWFSGWYQAVSLFSSAFSNSAEKLFLVAADHLDRLIVEAENSFFRWLEVQIDLVALFLGQNWFGMFMGHEDIVFGSQESLQFGEKKLFSGWLHRFYLNFINVIKGFIIKIKIRLIYVTNIKEVNHYY